MNRGNINFTLISSIVLDEADMMLKLGFKEDVDKVRYLASLKFRS